MESGLNHRERSRKFDASVRARVHYPADYTINTKYPLEIKQEVDSYRSTGAADEVSYAQLLAEAKRESQRPNDNGHEFQTRKEQLVLSHPFVNHRSNTMSDGSFTEWHGPLSPTRLVTGSSTRVDGFYDYPDFDVSTIRGQGAALVNRAIPTQPHASLAQALAEMKDGLPSIPLLSALKGKGTATSVGSSDYLNLQFGILPLISDINKICEAVKSSNKLVKQFARDSGRQVRRRRSLPVEDTVVTSSSRSDENALGLYWQDGSGPQMYFRSQCDYQGGHSWYTRVDTTETVQRRWRFSGAFTYFLSEDDSTLGKFDRYEQLANHLLGTRITPSTLYQLAPWSWLIDWFVDIGAVIDNATLLSNDGLVMNYGYLMCENIYTVKRVGYGFTFQKGDKLEPHTSIARTQSKQRWRANPYGFGITEDELNPFQWSILAALGMTKGGNILRR